MRKTTRLLPASLAALAAAVLVSPSGAAADGEFCISCTQPDQVYRCQVDTPQGDLNQKGLQLYCIIRTAEDGGHKSCAVQSDTGAACAGPARRYTFRAPELSPGVRAAAERLREGQSGENRDETLPEQKGGEPETLVDMTSRAVGASGNAARNAAGATGDTFGTIGQTVEKAARGTGKGVGKAAKGAGSAARTTGGAVTNAARTAYDCVRSLFSECGASGEIDQDPQTAP